MRKVERPKVVKIRRSKGEIVQDCDVYIGRKQTQGGWKILQDSEWANPYTLKKHGDKCMDLFREDLKQWIRDDPDTWIPKLMALESKILGCWCVDSNGNGVCHGNIIADFVVMACESELDGGEKFLEAVWGDKK